MKGMNKMLEGKTILLGVCACTPAYKSIEIAGKLVKMGADVKAIVTEHASHMVPVLVLQNVTKNPVQIDQFDNPIVWEENYKSWVASGDLLLLAPATADMIGKLANGICDDFLSTNTISFEKPKFIAMNMNPMQYRNKAVQRNIRQLAEDGYHFIDSDDEKVPSHMPSVDRIVDAVAGFLED